MYVTNKHSQEDRSAANNSWQLSISQTHTGSTFNTKDVEHIFEPKGVVSNALVNCTGIPSLRLFWCDDKQS